jgi:hypothetical protein
MLDVDIWIAPEIVDGFGDDSRGRVGQRRSGDDQARIGPGLLWRRKVSAALTPVVHAEGEDVALLGQRYDVSFANDDLGLMSQNLIRA